MNEKKFMKKVTRWLAGEISDDKFISKLSKKEAKELELRVLNATARIKGALPEVGTVQ